MPLAAELGDESYPISRTAGWRGVQGALSGDILRLSDEMHCSSTWRIRLTGKLDSDCGMRSLVVRGLPVGVQCSPFEAAIWHPVST